MAHDATDEMLDTIGALPYRQRAVLVLRYWLGLSEAEIAESLGCRAGTDCRRCRVGRRPCG